MSFVISVIIICLFIDYRIVESHKIIMKSIDELDKKIKQNNEQHNIIMKRIDELDKKLKNIEDYPILLKRIDELNKKLNINKPSK